MQAKSKRLTHEARKGDETKIKDDFKKAVQQSYQQAYSCASALLGLNPKLVNRSGDEVVVPQIVEIYPICIVADHYPSLNFQIRQFLTSLSHKSILDPLVTDVFALDSMTEMLDTPLEFLSYLRLRAKFGQKLIVSHELIALSYHLKQTLWVSDQHDLILLEDDIGADLEVSMTVRREGMPGKRTPDGFFVRHRVTALGRLLHQIESATSPTAVNLGLLLLTLNEEATLVISQAIEKISFLAASDWKSHDFTVGIASGAGLTVHSNYDSVRSATAQLRAHCEKRKYSQRASNWFGLAINPADASFRFSIELDYPWRQDQRMDELTRDLPKAQPVAMLAMLGATKAKVGRNEQCPCGSGRKYKKCCLLI